MKEFDFKSICENFKIEGKFIDATPYGEGHINDTFLVNTDTNKYILQRVNKNVFKNPEKLIENIAKVTEHTSKIIKSNGGDGKRETLNLIETTDGKFFYKSEDNDYFRMYIFIDNAICYQTVENADAFYQAARAFGQFQTMLKDFPAEELFETIPNFHNTVDRFNNFKKAIKEDKLGRLSSVQKEVDFALENEADAGIIVDALNTKKIPLRVTHNDTKLNNVMIDETTGLGICVIDLDTVMPGSMLFDFGDSIRFGASTAAEDELDLDKVNMDLSLFEAYTKGYLETLGESITKEEAELLPMSAKIMTLECGIRFLTDYLEGDTYFKIHRPDHNLDRARTQLKLVADMNKKMDDMKKVVAKYYKN